MVQIEKLMYLNKLLLEEMPKYREQARQFSKDYDNQRRLLRSLMNVSKSMQLSDDFLKVQDDFLSKEVLEKGIVDIADLKPTKNNKQTYLWQGDITTLNADAIVNAANSALLGCFIPCHGCIDNAIHSQAGLQLRKECNDIMKAQDHEEKTGIAKITKAYNLPSKYVIHTVGPIIYDKLTEKNCDLLESSYRECLKIAVQNNLKSIAFCCISTGEFHFPNDKASEIAVKTVTDYLSESKSEIEVIFNVFKEKDYLIYRELLGEDS